MSRAINTITAATAADGAANLNIDSGTLFIDTTNNNVGIGTTSPSYRLSFGANANQTFALYENAGGSNMFGFRFVGGSGADRTAFFANGTEWMSLINSGNVGIGTTSPAQKFVVSDGGINFVTSAGGGIQFVGTTTDNSLAIITNSVERLRIDSSGRVGIGTTSPVNKLSVESNGSLSSEIDISLINGTGNKECIINFGKNLATTDRYLGRIAYQVDNNNMLFYTNNTERLRITSGGKLLVGTTVENATQAGGIYDTSSGFHRISICKTASGGVNGILFYHNNSYVGGLNYTETATQLATSSDIRLKKDITESGSGLEKIKDIKIVSHGWKQHDEIVEFGVIAQELYDVYPKAIFRGDDGDIVEKPWSVDYVSLVPLAIKAIQELKAENDSLKTRIAAMEAA